MYSTITPEYDRKFPALERKMDSITSRTFKPFIHPSEVQLDGKLKHLTKAEEVLNWKSENMVSQNEILHNLDKKETPPQKIQKEEESPEKGFQAMTITINYESPRKNYPLAESSTQKGDGSSTYGDNNSEQETSTDETPRSFSSNSKFEDNYIPRLFMENIKEEKSPEETLVP
ncbi:hypothetical protein KIW84_071342 [Lathyrus oleraceus]|uniref:Uncharacterized protein n=1 Tax=Pisum sativum TaxID=3888 RepID=A0A9D4ZT16_PEA|nr:hypothetical protein KIW84_071342 [Pisum sativum]